MLKIAKGRLLGSDDERLGFRLLRLREVISRTGLSRSTIYDKMAANVFPKPLKLGLRAVAWRESEVQAWMAERIAARDGKAA